MENSVFDHSLMTNYLCFHFPVVVCVLYGVHTQWAFGVTCWEVFSLGRVPYPGLDNADIPDYISRGKRLKKPPLAPQEL